MKSVPGTIVAGVVVTAVMLCVGIGPTASVSGQPPTEKPVATPSAQALALQYVPADASVFIHLDVQKLWVGLIGAGGRGMEPKLLAEFAEKIRSLIGVTPDGLESATLFLPEFQFAQERVEKMGLVLVYRAPLDKAQLTAAINKQATKPVRTSVHVVSDRMAVILFQLDKKYAEPRPAGSTGPLLPIIQEAASGQHLLVVGATPKKLVDPEKGSAELLAFRSLLEAEAASVVVTQNKELVIEARFQAGTPAKAIEGEKALGLVVTLLTEGMERMARDPVNEDDLAEASMAALIKGTIPGMKAASFRTEGRQTRVRITIPGDLPVGAVLVPPLLNIGQAAARTKSANNLHQIGIAMHHYHDSHKMLPPAILVDKAGKPLLSWRVLLLPSIEQEALYKEFHLDEPWDSEHNKKLIPKIPQTYVLPEDTDPKRGLTHYRVFVGNGAAFDPLRGVKFDEFTDGLTDTLLVVTAADSVPWTKPDELTFDPAKDPRKLLKMTGGGANVLFADAHEVFLSKSVDDTTVRRLITRAEGIPAGFGE